MKTLVLIISLLHLRAVESQQDTACIKPKISKVDVAFSCTGKAEQCLPTVTATALGASRGQFQDLQLASQDVSSAEYTNITLTHRTDIWERDKLHLRKGIFTAAAKGVYVLRLSAQDVATVAAGAPSDTGTKVLTLMLEEGEQVHVGLRPQSAARFHFHAHVHIHVHVHIRVKKLW